MKTSSPKFATKKILSLILFGIAVSSLFSVQPAQAYTVTLQQMGADVVANGSGPVSLTGLTFSGLSGQDGALINPIFGVIVMGTTKFANVDIYTGLSGPTSFGSGGLNDANIGSGRRVGIVGPLLGPFLFLPAGYISDTALSSSSTWNNATFASLGVNPGTYVWSWGTGLPNQNFTLIVGGAGVPDAGSTVSLLGCALLGLAGLRRKFSC